jgi:cysteine desulfurase/selenocysteine lyase
LKSKTCTSRSTVPLPARYGVTATCRASFALYNTKDEVDTLAESMVKARE